jgi:hypothetical protein
MVLVSQWFMSQNSWNAAACDGAKSAFMLEELNVTKKPQHHGKALARTQFFICWPKYHVCLQWQQAAGEPLVRWCVSPEHWIISCRIHHSLVNLFPADDVALE